MTQAEKVRINKLRADGLGATRIAKKLGLSVNTVKSYLSRAPVIEKGLEPNVAGGDNCKQCGAPLSQHPLRKAKLFCSDACRVTWWNAHRGEIESKATVTLSCVYCKAPFGSYRSESRKYCCHTCYIKDRFGGEHFD